VKALFKNILIIADIEGSSGCWSYAGSSFMTDQWCDACVDMTHDVNAQRAPLPGIGHPGNARAVMFLGMHAASGTDGFLAHTLTSRVEKLTVNGEPMAEIELFSASLAPFGIRPIFFSGCPVACEQARQTISGIDVYPIDKSPAPKDFDKQLWRAGLGQAAAESLKNESTTTYTPKGPFSAVIHMRDGEKVA
jgi:D-aminopeptidase